MNRHEYAAHADLVEAARIMRERRHADTLRTAAVRRQGRAREQHKAGRRFLAALVGWECGVLAALFFVGRMVA